VKPKHQGGYTALHAELCERTLVTLLRGLGPWKSGVYLAGGLVPRYLIARPPQGQPEPPSHADTTDVDLVLDLQVLAGIDGLVPVGTTGEAPTLTPAERDRVIAITVALAILGTTLSAMNTGVRITYAMAQDEEMPELLGLLHGRFANPHFGVIAMTVVSAIIGVIGVTSVVALTGITLASNFGTFVLYALTCLWAIIAFASRPDFNWFKHLVIPGLGLLANIVLLVVILGVGFVGGGDSQTESLMAIGFAVVWAVASAAYVVVNNRRTGRSLVASPKAAA